MSIHKDSLLNEYKGNLFEFLVGQKLAQTFGIEADFLQSLGPQFFSILKEQERFLSNEYPHLLQDLPVLASATQEKILKEMAFQKIIKIHLIGKMASGSGDGRFFECDLLLKSETKDFPISLKLSKKGAYVNTKSAGLKSFLSKYFARLDGESFQKELDAFVEVEFEAMARLLYKEHELEYDRAFIIWREENLPIRPGELNEVDRKILHEYYHKLNCKLYELVGEMRKKDTSLFARCLLPLIGQGSSDMIQVICYYETKNQHHELARVDFKCGQKEPSCELLELKENVGNFVISLHDQLLQIRIKPMKTFVQPSFKVNCSVKTISL